MSLIESAMDNDLPALKTLIAAGADINDVTEHGRTALWYAAASGFDNCVAALLDAKADVNKSDENGDIPLHFASLNGCVKCVQLLVQRKANVNALNTLGSSPLHFASSFGHLACTQILIASGAERDRPTTERLYTPLAYAIMSNDLNVAQFLLHSGAKMKNVPPYVEIRAWMTNIIQKRRSVMSFMLALKGLLKRRFGISKDVTNLLGLYVWCMRLK